MSYFAGYIAALESANKEVLVYVPGSGFVAAKIDYVQDDMVRVIPTQGQFQYVMSLGAVCIKADK
jgi:hypothetical protein